MNADIKERWLAALRSGDYIQGRQRLTNVTLIGNKFCCLGVLCDLAVRDGVVTSRPARADGDQYLDYGGSADTPGSWAYLPVEVQVWAGLEARNPMVTDLAVGLTHLATMNDNDRSFAEIANAIEGSL